MSYVDIEDVVVRVCIYQGYLGKRYYASQMVGKQLIKEER